jgi:hypothetical protein
MVGAKAVRKKRATDKSGEVDGIYGSLSSPTRECWVS